MVYVYA